MKENGSMKENEFKKGNEIMKENEFTGISEEEAKRFVAQKHPEFLVYKAEFRDNYSFYLMEREGRGMVRLFVDTATQKYFVSDLSVAPSARRKGLANTMLSLAEELVQLHNRHVIHLYSDSSSWVTEW